MKRIVVVLAIFFTIAAYAQNDGDDISIGKYKIIHSDILNEDRTLLIHLPRNYDNETNSYPVLYMLYGDHTNTYFAETVSVLNKYASNGKIPKIILVAITNTDRYRDLIPFDRNGEKTGIDNFIQFFEKELIPLIDKNYRTKDYRILMGPQAGANFSFYTLFKNPDLFDAYIINNPFRWNSGRDFMLNQSMLYFENHDSFKKYLFITHDQNDKLEIEGNEYINKFRSYVDEKNPKDFNLVLNFLPNSTDFVSPTGISEGIQTLFNGYLIPDDIVINSLSDIQEYYSKLSNKLGFTIDIPGHVLTTKSDELISQAKENEAVEIYNYMIKTNADVTNAYWRLANLSIQKEDYLQAKNYLEKMMEIMKDDVGVIKRRLEMVNQKLEEKN